MKKKNLWMLATGALLAVGLISCTSNSKTVIPPNDNSPVAAYAAIVPNTWQISSVVFKKSDYITDSLNYTSTDSLSSSKIVFWIDAIHGYKVYVSGDTNNAAKGGPMNDSTLFRYGDGDWYFDANWNARVNAGNRSAAPDSLIFSVGNNQNFGGHVFRSKINRLDSLHLQITYLDSSIMNTTTHTKYNTMKVVSFIPTSGWWFFAQ